MTRSRELDAFPEQRDEPEPGAHEPVVGGQAVPVLSRSAVVGLQASAGNRAVTALLQRAALGDYNDTDPLHDPSRLSDTEIRATDEYKRYMAKNPMPVPMRDIEAAEATLACRLLLRRMRQSVAPTTTVSEMELMYWLDAARSRMAATSTAEATVGSEQWVQVTPNDVNKPGAAASDFVQWMLAGGTEPNAATGKMNCWEMVLFSAYRAGVLTEKRMRDFYTQAKAKMTTSKDVMEFPRELERLMRSSAEQTYDPSDTKSPRPLRGDLVIFKEAAGHVALATGKLSGGKVEVVSHWPPPDGKYTVKITTIEDLMPSVGVTTAKFWGPSW